MNIRKKIIGGIAIVMMVATIGAVFATAQTNGANQSGTAQHTFRDRVPMNGLRPCGYNLTADQQAELEALMTTLQNENATPQQIRQAIQTKLEEYGVYDIQLNNDITQTEQRLTILNREKELRTQGYNWTEIHTMIQQEFNLTNPTGYDQGMMVGHRFGRMPHGGPCNIDSDETTEQ
jgi:hypothetical protein